MKYNNIGDCRTINEYVQKKLSTLNSMEHTFPTLFEFMFSEKNAVLYERSVGYKIIKTTYGQAYENAKRRAFSLSKILSGMPHDSVVGIYMENCVEYIETLWAVLLSGFKPLLLNLRLDFDILNSVLNDCHAIAVITDKDAFCIKTINQSQLLDYDELYNSVNFGTEVLVMSTGTSNNVKICGYGAKEFCSLVNDSVSVVRECKQISKHYNGEIKLLTFLPLYHVFGLVAMYVWFAFFSRSFVHLQNLEPQTILNTIRRHEVTHIFAVPLFWERIFEKAEQGIHERGEKTVKKFNVGVRIGNALDFCPPLAKIFRKIAFRQVRELLFGESVLFMITGGSPIRKDAISFFNHIGYHLANGYGMTEIGITSVECSSSAKKLNSGSVGKPLDSVTYKIDTTGELLVKGSSLAKTILHNGILTVRDDEQWFHTGDIAEYTNGIYKILGRKDDLILLSNGEMLNPNLIEPRFARPEYIGVCLINASKSEDVIPTLLISVKNGTDKSKIDHYRKDVLEQIKAFKLETHIKNIVFISETLIGDNDFKLNRKALTKRFLAGQIQIASENDKNEKEIIGDLEMQVIAVFASVLNKHVNEINIDSDFFIDEGGSSLDYFAMLAVLKETFGFPFEVTEKSNFHTVRGICEYIEGANQYVN